MQFSVEKEQTCRSRCHRPVSDMHSWEHREVLSLSPSLCKDGSFLERCKCSAIEDSGCKLQGKISTSSFKAHKVGEGVRFKLLPSMLFYKSFRSELNNNNNNNN